MECPRCSGEKWIRFYKIERPNENTIERKLICANCNLIVITEETSTYNQNTSLTLATYSSPNRNIRYKVQRDSGVRYRSVERIRYVIIYSPALNQSIPLDYKLYKWDLDEHYKNKLNTNKNNE